MGERHHSAQQDSHHGRTGIPLRNRTLSLMGELAPLCAEDSLSSQGELAPLCAEVSPKE